MKDKPLMGAINERIDLLKSVVNSQQNLNNPKDNDLNINALKLFLRLVSIEIRDFQHFLEGE